MPTAPPTVRTKTQIRPERGSGPHRTCVGCQAVRPQRELVRVARASDGSLAIGRTLPGRGAWLCFASPSCLDLAVRRGGFARSFRSSVSTAAIAELRSTMAADQQT